jgi:hypothetical protein
VVGLTQRCWPSGRRGRGHYSAGEALEEVPDAGLAAGRRRRSMLDGPARVAGERGERRQWEPWGAWEQELGRGIGEAS